jgi:hypothetical protein
MSGKRLADALRQKIAAAAKDGNVAAAVNTGKSGSHTSVKSTKRVIQKDGVTSVTEEREERRG